MRSRLGEFLVVTVLAVGLTACSPNEPDFVAPRSTSPSPSSSATQLPTPESVESPKQEEGEGEGPLGAKWDWGRFESFEPYLERLGGGSTFYELVWCQVEETPGSRDWATLDRIAKRAEGTDVQLMLKIRVGQCWATGSEGKFVRGKKSKTESGVPRSDQEYVDFVTEAVKRYSTRGVKVWAVENEVNSASFWAGSVTEYANLVATAATAIRAVDPSAVIVDAGLSSTSYGVGIAQSFLDAGEPKKAVDAWNGYYSRRFGSRGDELVRVADERDLRVALQGEQQRRNAEYLEGTAELLRTGIVDVRQVHFYEDADVTPLLVDYALATTPKTVPIEVWETGSFVRGNELSQDEQVVDLVRKVSMLLAGGVRKTLWLPLIPNPEGRNSDEPRSGLLAPDGQVRPLGEVYATMAEDARGANAVPVDDGDLRGVALVRGERSVAYVWSTDKPRDLASGVDVQSLVPGGGQTDQVGPAPVRVIGTGSPEKLLRTAP